jgi:hypothetical protein
MKTIYKYTTTDCFLALNAPVTRLLSAQCQRDEICIWAEVDTEAEDRHFIFFALGTGWNLSGFNHFDKMQYLSTTQQFDGDLIWHIYYLELNEPFKEGQK